VFAFPITLERVRPIGAYAKNDRVTRGKRRKLVAKAGEMGTTIRSKKTSHEDQGNIFFTAKFKQCYRPAIHIIQFEIRRKLYFIGHYSSVVVQD
jgi:hypothetical protein